MKIWKELAIGTAVVLALGVVVWFVGRPKKPGDTEKPGGTEPESAGAVSAERPESVSYEVLSTVRYEGDGVFRSQAAGVLCIGRNRPQGGVESYDYSWNASVGSPGADGEAQVVFPMVSLVRKVDSERFVGGDALLRNLGIVSNAALDQVKQTAAWDGRPQSRRFILRVGPSFPQRVGYRLMGKRQNVAGEGNRIVALAISDRLDYRTPGSGEAVAAQHGVICITDGTMERVLFAASRFVAVPAEDAGDCTELLDGSAPTTPPRASERVDSRGEAGRLEIQTVIRESRDGRLATLNGLDASIQEWFGQLHFSAGEREEKTNRGMPLWAMHSVAVRGEAELVAGAVIEGKPNFVITATVGMVLLADSAVSAGTQLAHELDWIDWEWGGIPNYVGGQVGLAAAEGFEDLAGTNVDEQHWKEVGGIVADAASVFIPSKVAGAGVKVALDGTRVGVKVVKTGEMGGKAIRISTDGLQLVKATSWLGSKAVSSKVTMAEKLLTLGKAGYEGVKATRETSEASTEDRTPPPTGKIPVAVGSGRLPAELRAGIEIPGGRNDMYGNPVKQGIDPATRWPLEVRHKATGVHFVFIPAGEFMMGSPKDQKDRDRDEGPVHKVKISKAFYMAKYEVTQAEWKKVTGDEPWAGRVNTKASPSNPASYVSWDDCQEFIKKLNDTLGCSSPRTGVGAGLAQSSGAQQAAPLRFALPTEAQWEYACRAGTTTRFSYGDDADYSKLGDYAWYDGNAWSKGDAYPHAVGQKKPNPWGLYDMHGNVWEWCGDWDATYDEGDVSDPCGPETGGTRVFRGGDFEGDGDLRSASRFGHWLGDSGYFLGFRLALSPVQR